MTLGNQKYGDFYYADINDTMNIASRIISVTITSSGYNRASFAIFAGSGVVRVFGDNPNSLTEVRVSYV